MNENTKNNNSYPSLFFSIILLSLLVTPYVLKLFVSEPYPAIILPSGHTRYEKGTNIVNREFGCFVFFENQRREIQAEELLSSSMPKGHIWAIVSNHLGLKDKSKEQIQELRQWYSNNIGSPIDSIELVTYKATRNIKNGKLLQREIIKNEIYNLAE